MYSHPPLEPFPTITGIISYYILYYRAPLSITIGPVHFLHGSHKIEAVTVLLGWQGSEGPQGQQMSCGMRINYPIPHTTLANYMPLEDVQQQLQHPTSTLWGASEAWTESAVD